MSTETSPPAASTASPPTRRPRRGYGGMWRGLFPELGFLLPMLPIVITGLIIVATLFFTGVGMIAIVVGLFVILAGLYVSRGLGMFELMRLRGAGHREITPPPWDRVAPRTGFWGRALAPAVDGHYWLYLLHTMVVNPIVGTVTWSITIVWVVGTVSGLTYWSWQGFLLDDDRSGNLLQLVADVVGADSSSALPLDDRTADSIFYLLLGVVFALTLPLVTRGLTLLHWAIANGMLGGFRSEQLEVQVAGLAASRSAAAAAEGTALRRLERDIHDGPQQRLVRLQMDIAAADRQVEADPERARELLAEALQQSRDALDELRALSRGFAPPLLLDRGLVAALHALADRNPVPVSFTAHVPPEFSVPVELERNAYFIAAEGITNATKHAGATAIALSLALRRIPDGDQSWLDLTIQDDGRGGAITVAGHGLAGLAERARGVGGTLEVASPIGGPTVITARLPLTHALPSSAPPSAPAP
ncbi:MAG: sensor domain-containing protein [Microbacteriaceae bacterium]